MSARRPSRSVLRVPAMWSSSVGWPDDTRGRYARRVPAWDRPLSRRRFLGTAAAAAVGAGPLAAIARGAASGSCRPAEPGALGDRPRRGRDDGEPLVRPLPGLAPRRRRQAGGPRVSRRRRRVRIRRIPSRPTSRGAPSPTRITRTTGSRVAWNNGACDGWLRAGKNDDFAIGYYSQNDLAVPRTRPRPRFTACDRYFAPILGPTFPNRFYALAGVTDRLENAFSRVELPDDLRPARRQEAPRRVLLRQHELPAPLEPEVQPDHAHVRPVLRGLQARHDCRSSRSSIRTTRSTTRARSRESATTTIPTPTSAWASTSSRRSTTP